MGVTVAVLALVSHHSLNAGTFLRNLAMLVGTVNGAIMRLDADIQAPTTMATTRMNLLVDDVASYEEKERKDHLRIMLKNSCLHLARLSLRLP